jgi:hypothetical protein
MDEFARPEVQIGHSMHALDNIIADLTRLAAKDQQHRNMMRQSQEPLELPKFLRRRNSVLCLRCLVEIEADKIFLPSRCVDAACPLKPRGE